MAAKKKKPTASGGGGRLKWVGITLGFGLILFVSPAMAALTVVGLAPTLAAWLVGQGPFKNQRLRTIFLFNASGLMPYLIAVWGSGKGFSAALAIMSDIFSWLVMYGTAALGLAALWLAPQIAATFRQMAASERARRLGRMRQKIIRKWGNEIAGEVRDKNLPQPGESKPQATNI